jgi:nicotinate-nucleotide--dimethylbenzimidazole phosphoribosyltransferase
MNHQLEMLLARISDPDQAARTRALERQAQLTKPTGSLGRLEELSVWLARKNRILLGKL